MIKVFPHLVLSLLLAGVTQVEVQAQAELVGCISQIPNGGLQLEVGPSGISYAIEGDPNVLVRNIHHLVRVHGQETSAATQGNPQPVFKVQQLEQIANSCTSPLPASVPVAVVGKSGEGQVALPITTSVSAGQTTPGFQTEDVADQEPPASGRSGARLSETQKSVYAPSNIAQAAQTSEAANTYAQAATRTEIEPGNTLGGESYVVSSRIGNAASRAVSVQLRGDATQQFSPATVTVKVGTPVKWTNLSNRTHEITANPGRKESSTGVLPPGGRPFDSGFLRPGASFTHAFEMPGVYQYYCSVGCTGNSTGKVIVQQ